MPENLPFNPEKQTDKVKNEFSVSGLDSLGSQKKSNKNLVAIFLIIIASLLLVIIGFGYYFFYNSSSNPNLASNSLVNKQELSLDEPTQQDNTTQIDPKLGNINNPAKTTFRDEDFGIAFSHPTSWNIDLRYYKLPDESVGTLPPELVYKINKIKLTYTFGVDEVLRASTLFEIDINQTQRKNIADGYIDAYEQWLNNRVCYDLRYCLEGEIIESFTVDNRDIIFLPLLANKSIAFLQNGNTLYDIGFKTSGAVSNIGIPISKLYQVMKDFLLTIKVFGDGRIEGGNNFYNPDEPSGVGFDGIEYGQFLDIKYGIFESLPNSVNEN